MFADLKEKFKKNVLKMQQIRAAHEKKEKEKYEIDWDKYGIKINRF